MTRAEFLQGLRTELEGRVPYSVIQENIRYYDSYISDEISKGADEAEVIENHKFHSRPDDLLYLVLHLRSSWQ